MSREGPAARARVPRPPGSASAPPRSSRPGGAPSTLRLSSRSPHSPPAQPAASAWRQHPLHPRQPEPARRLLPAAQRTGRGLGGAGPRGRGQQRPRLAPPASHQWTGRDLEGAGPHGKGGAGGGLSRTPAPLAGQVCGRGLERRGVVSRTEAGLCRAPSTAVQGSRPPHEGRSQGTRGPGAGRGLWGMSGPRLSPPVSPAADGAQERRERL